MNATRIRDSRQGRMDGPKGQSKRQERLAIMKNLKKANKRARKLNQARQAREAAKAIPVARPPSLDVVQVNRGINVVYDDARDLVEKA